MPPASSQSNLSLTDTIWVALFVLRPVTYFKIKKYFKNTKNVLQSDSPMFWQCGMLSTTNSLSHKWAFQRGMRMKDYTILQPLPCYSADWQSAAVTRKQNTAMHQQRHGSGWLLASMGACKRFMIQTRHVFLRETSILFPCCTFE